MLITYQIVHKPEDTVPSSVHCILFQQADILIDISIEVDEPEALQNIRQISGVQQAHLVVGPNDCIAYVEADNQDGALAILRAICAVPGVLRTDMRSAAQM